MRRLFNFLVCLFSFWTWKGFFLRWLQRLPYFHANGEPVEHILSQNGIQKSKLARFLSSLPKGRSQCEQLAFHGDLEVRGAFGGSHFTFIHGTGVEASFNEFLEGVSSSEIVFDDRVRLRLHGDNSYKYVEAFADALCKSSKKFKELYVYGGDGFEVDGGDDGGDDFLVSFAKCISSVVLGNDAIQNLKLHFGFLKRKMDKELVAEFMANIVMPHNLRVLKSFVMGVVKLDGEGMEQFMKPFQGPPCILEELDLYFLTSDAQLEHISGVLASNTSLKSLELSKEASVRGRAFTSGYSSIAAALGSNQSLEFLSCYISNSSELEVLLEPLMPRNNNLQRNTTLTKLKLESSTVGKEGMEILIDMLCTNTSLLGLDLDYLDDLSSNDPQGVGNALAILEALKTNKSLKEISFRGCSAVGGYQVLGAMMDLLLENHKIQDIDLYNTGLAKSGDADYVSSILSRRKKMKLWDVVQNMAIVNPTSGRIFLCGEPYAGKTTLRLSLKQLKEFHQKDTIPYRSKMKGKLQNVLKTFHPPKQQKEDKPLERTHGIEVENVQCNGIGITIWDMAGQSDYHSFHELVMPNLSADGSSSMFLLMCNPMEQVNLSKRRCLSDIRLELESWLRFIASNTRRSLLYRPHVSIVMTHLDYWMDDHLFADRIGDEVEQLKLQFQEVLQFDKDKSVFKVDGTSLPCAREVFDFMKSHMKKLLEKMPKTIRACEEVQRLVALWNANKSNRPLLKWEEFCEGLCEEVEELNDVDHELERRKREFVAISLNDGGHIIYNEKGVVITNPHWFCHQIVGQFLHQCVIMSGELEMVSANGVISIKDMKRLILELLEGQGDIKKQFDDILSIMVKLHICYEQDASSIMIPSTLKDKHKSLSWSTNDDSTTFNYVGRRLACKDVIKTMLTPGFFTRLQVSFFKKLQNKNDQDTYKVFQDVIKFISGQGIEVILQFHQGNIDILLRSHQCQDGMLEFLENGIVMHIKHLQEDPTLGCPGVRLIEHILRPACVQRLVHAKDRKNQCVLVKDLEAKVIEIGVGATHNWQSCEGLDIGYNKVRALLGSVAWKNLLEKQARDLQDYHKEIQSLGTMTQDDEPNSNHEKSSLWTFSLWQSPQRLLYGPLDEKLDNMRRENREYHKETMSKLDNVEHLIQNLECSIQRMQRDLLQEVCLKIDALMAFSLEMQQSQIPKLAYLCKFGEKKLLTRFVPNLDRIQLHLMCESIYGFHEVPNQEGCVVYFGTEHTRRFLTMVAWGLKIATLLTKVGAHIACGMGSIVPDFSDGGTFAALVLDTPGLLDYRMPSATLESLPSDFKKYSRISIDNLSEAQRWLQEFLEPKCQKKRDFYEQFGLKKVRFRRARGCIAWICDKCFSQHYNDIDELK